MNSGQKQNERDRQHKTDNQRQCNSQLHGAIVEFHFATLQLLRVQGNAYIWSFVPVPQKQEWRKFSPATAELVPNQFFLYSWLPISGLADG